MKRAAVILALMLVVCTPAAATPVSSLDSSIRALVAAQKGVLHAGVAIVHVERGERVTIDGERPYPLASVFKLPLLVELGRRLQAGSLRLDQRLVVRDDQKIIGSGTLRNRPAGSRVSVAEAIELMETISDNTATDILFDVIGLGSVNDLMRGLGLAGTDIYLTNRAAWLVCLGMGRGLRGLSARAIADRWQAMTPAARRAAAARVVDENRHTTLAAIQRAEDASLARPRADDMRLAAVVDNLSSPSDIAAILVKLQQGEILDGRWTQYCMGVLGRQRFNTRIPRNLPKGVRTFHKTGSILGVVNDAGLIEIGPRSHVVVVVLCRDVAQGGEASAEALIGRIARAAYDHYR